MKTEYIYKINKTIAEACGWKPRLTAFYCSNDEGLSGWGTFGRKYEAEQFLDTIGINDTRHGSKVFPLYENPPNYYGDLNACHEMEKALDPVQEWHGEEHNYNAAIATSNHETERGGWLWLRIGARTPRSSRRPRNLCRLCLLTMRSRKTSQIPARNLHQ